MPELVVMTLNLKCRAAHYEQRWPLLVQALARDRPDVVGLQEDCVAPGGRSQADELAEALLERTGRTYSVVRASTHEAMVGGIFYDEGVSVLSAWPIEASRVLDLPSHQFHRRAVVVDLRVHGFPLRFACAHLDWGEDNEHVRAAGVHMITEELRDGLAVVVTGDMNATPETRAVLLFKERLVDLWARARPGEPGWTFPANDPDRRIDYLLATPGLARGLKRAWLVAENDGAMWLSDHLGVAAALEWP